MKYVIKIALAGMLLLTATAYAQDEEEAVDAWEGTGEFGFVNTTGNTESVAMNAKLNFIRTGKRWRHRFSGTALMTSEDGETDNERYTMEVQSDHKINEKAWLFGAFRWDADKFGSYDPQVSLTAGYGRQLMKSEKHGLKAEIGAGYRRLEETVHDVEEPDQLPEEPGQLPEEPVGGETSSEAIVRFLVDDSWQVFKTTLWTNRLLVESGSSNTFSQFNTELAVSMTDKFAIKLGFEARNNTKIPPGDTEHTDTITSANLVYNF